MSERVSPPQNRNLDITSAVWFDQKSAGYGDIYGLKTKGGDLQGDAQLIVTHLDGRNPDIYNADASKFDFKKGGTISVPGLGKISQEDSTSPTIVTRDAGGPDTVLSPGNGHTMNNFHNALNKKPDAVFRPI